MSDMSAIAILLIALTAVGGMLRAIYGLFAWKGQRKKALFQLLAFPLGGIGLMGIFAVSDPSASGGAEKDQASATVIGAETIEIAQSAPEPAPVSEPEPEPAPDTVLGQWCYQEQINESFDRVITIAQQADEQFIARLVFRDSEGVRDLEREDERKFVISGGYGEFYMISKDQRHLEIHDDDGLIGTAEIHTDDADCFRPEGTAQEELRAEREANACRNDLSCWAEKHFVAASVRCRGPIERSANFSMEWTDLWYEQKLSHFRWRDQEAGVVTYIGDKARFQNGFGAWQNVIYDCDYDTLNDTVMDIRVRAGRLN